MQTLYDKMMKRYSINVKCSNCGLVAIMSIPKGVSIKSWLKEKRTVCRDCGVNSLKVYNEDSYY